MTVFQNESIKGILAKAKGTVSESRLCLKEEDEQLLKLSIAERLFSVKLNQA